ncbi:MAG: hypothetical protein KGH65_00025 [Candidatus Micrarchaeota archaeon]|nr:hypothetical protein [Candidatus Micrarchaeota archaeon]
MSETPAVKAPPNPKELGARSDQTLELADKIKEIVRRSETGTLGVSIAIVWELLRASSIEPAFKSKLKEIFSSIEDLAPRSNDPLANLKPKNRIRKIALDFPEYIPRAIAIARLLNLPRAVEILKREDAKQQAKPNEKRDIMLEKDFNEGVKKLEYLTKRASRSS